MNRPLLCSALVASVLAGACSSDPTQGYSVTRPYRNDIQTVAVPVFNNTTFARGMEVRLTESVIGEIRRQTPWKVADASSAQTTLTGTITSSQMRVGSLGQTTGLVEDQVVIVSIDFEWKDNRTGKVLVARRQFQAVQSFVPAQGVQERIELAQNATVQELARDLVAELRSSW
ncbi:MAG: hypothetical protein ACREJO_10765 [Phycisphaerales bacterium]